VKFASRLWFEQIKSSVKFACRSLQGTILLYTYILDVWWVRTVHMNKQKIFVRQDSGLPKK